MAPSETPSSAMYSRFTAPIRNDDKPGFDVHVYFHPDDEKEVQYAEDLRQSIKQEFPDLIVFTKHHKPIGPHPIGMFEVDIFSPAQFGALIPWLAIHHGPLSVLIHPNTGDSRSDHTQSAIWIGEKLSMDLGVFNRFEEMETLTTKLERLRNAQDL